MNNKNFYEDTKYIIVALFIICTFLLIVAAQANKEQEILATCDCAETFEGILDEKITSYIEVVTTKENTIDKDAELDTEKSDNIVEQQLGINPTPTKFHIGESALVPTLPTNVKTFTDYRSYNLVRTPHYRLQQAAYTDGNGLRRFNEDYIVAMGSFYSVDIGDRFKITLDTGYEFSVILGDGKHPADCDPTNMYDPCINYDGENCANVLEFIIDSDVMSPNVYSYGSIDCIEGFGGNIVKMEYLGRDQSADWTTY